ncbi:MAG: LuxR C-terminal-related transcriptional regulator [Planctomycetota bacterium]
MSRKREGGMAPPTPTAERPGGAIPPTTAAAAIDPGAEHAAAYAVIVVARDGRCLYSPNLPGVIDSYPWELCWDAEGLERLRAAFIDACMFRRRRQDVEASLRVGERCYDFRVWLDPAGDDLVIGRLVRRFGDTLSPREREVLALVAGGADNAQIARLLGTSETTVRTHLKNTRAKLGVSRSEGLLLAAAGVEGVG